mmetsp:Transcript_3047/g.6171  ORF Transcript_3047/g.6171 Transcript_3047/m.6171 type:complete len:320 (+) Transcript_3047:233-1192(+)|eukprot:CAMPEP_0182565098 /NCGR_PEP_ID=MMETSP1324-20130603/6884_1 /TAXON_ID=236786 /ORGANISM="Florenciella sp., Strain RCC1587" /LENGTH=319 /DNA_ID=CAMNT_0024778691 /DNA_START=227 /DNA_END=1186 /DNA_ORIENTATION=-
MSIRTSMNHQPAVVATSAPSGGGGKGPARMMGAAVAGVSELLIFHPVDTVAKRLMMTEKALIVPSNFAVTTGNLNQAIFREAASVGVFQKWQSLFPGLGFGAGYKILQRVYKFGGQPYVKEYIDRNFGDVFRSTFGAKTGKTIMAATAGSIMGVGEIALLPLDVLKIRSQTNPESLKGRGVVQIFREEGMSLYRGAGWTAARNAPGSFSLFGGAALSKQMMGIQDGEATWTQDAIASIAGATASITVAAPLDVIKTRLQSGTSTESGTTILLNLARTEGPGAFFRGLWPKLLVVGPKLVFSFTVAQQMIGVFERQMGGR